MRVLSRRVDVAEVRQGGRFRLPFGNRQMAVVKGKDNHVTWQIKNALWEMVDPKRRDLQMAEHDPIEDESVIRVVVTLPINPEGVKEIEADVRDQLDREGYEEAFPNLSYSFAPARFPVDSGENHMFVSMIYPLRGAGIHSIERIMGKNEDHNRFNSEDGRIYQIGFGNQPLHATRRRTRARSHSIQLPVARTPPPSRAGTGDHPDTHRRRRTAVWQRLHQRR